MLEATDRLRRLITDEVGQCRDKDLEQRLAALERLDELTPEVRDGDVHVLSTLASDTRLRIVRLLDTLGDELCVCEITPLVDVGESAVSHALSDLREAGLVERREEGKWRFYRATDRAAALLDALDRESDEGDA